MSELAQIQRSLPSISLVDIYSLAGQSAYETLFRLLLEREDHVNISHRSAPNIERHIAFVESRPYAAWYLILGDDFADPLGAIYLTKRDEIGVFVFAARQGQGVGPAAIAALIERHGARRYLANINPRNHRSIGVFAERGFRHVQNTYELDLSDSR